MAQGKCVIPSRNRTFPFVINSAVDGSNRVHIADYSVEDDIFYLDDAVFAGLTARAYLVPSAFHMGATAADALDRIIYNPGNGKLFFDVDGSGPRAAVQFASVPPGLAMTHREFYVY